MIFHFGEFQFDTLVLELRHDDKPVHIEPQVFDLLRLLIENRDRVVTKDEIIDAVWDGRIVSDTTMNSRINSARRAVGDDGRRQEVIHTQPRRGFRFVAPVTVADEAPSSGGSAEPRSDTAHDRADEPSTTSEHPSIAVLPFANVSGDPEQEYFADGMAEEIITALSHIRQFLVIARNTTFTYKGQAVDVSAVARDLGVRYVIEGSVRKAGNRVRITVQLIDGASGAHLWAEKYDRDLEDIFAVQDEITLSVVGAIQPEVAVAELERARSKPPERMDAWDFYLRGKAPYHLYSRDGILEAVSYFERAIELDPGFALAHAALAQACQHQIAFDFVEDREQTARRARQATEKAVALDRDDAETQVALAWMLWSQGEIDEAVSVFRKAVELNPSHANAHSLLGLVLGTAGYPEEGIIHHQTVLRLSPRDPGLASFVARYAFTCIAARRHDQALDLAKNALRLSSGRNWMMFTHLIVALAHLGRTDEAAVQVERMTTLHPDVTIDSVRNAIHYVSPEDLDYYADGLRKAGLPE